MRQQGKRKFPQPGDKIWRELEEFEIEEGAGANGTIIKRDFESSPVEYIALFPKGRDHGVSQRRSFTLGDISWTDRFGGTWYSGSLPSYDAPTHSSEGEALASSEGAVAEGSKSDPEAE